jgi:HAD superfamily hydrolase (TIGR01509 family)
MDGVLTDSEPLICAAAMAMFKEQGVIVQAEDFHSYIGTGENRYLGGVAEKYGLTIDIRTAKARTYDLYLAMVPTRLQAFPGAVELVRRLQTGGCPCAVASSADRIKINANLNKIGLPPETWQAIVTAEDVEHRKPDPAIFLTASRRLGISPHDCTVVEDAVNGIAAAKAAGMRCVAVASTFPAHQLTQADLIRSSIADITLDDLN